MKVKFDEIKTTQASALLMQACNERRMPYIKLIKLLYLADREALSRWGRPITSDTYVSMRNGPVLSRTLDLITDESEEKTYWYNFFSPAKGFDIELKKKPDFDELSKAEIDLIKEIASKFGSMGKWDLVDNVMHKLPEWSNPGNGAIPIEYEDILKAFHKTPQEINGILEELEFISRAQPFLDK
jgi:uncharacterized phage-associated protein